MPPSVSGAPTCWTRRPSCRNQGSPTCVSPLRRADSVRAPALEARSEEHTSELQSRSDLVCRLLLEKKKTLNHVSCHERIAAQIEEVVVDSHVVVHQNISPDPGQLRLDIDSRGGRLVLHGRSLLRL